MAGENNVWDGSDADHDATAAANWSLGTAPANTENIFIPAGNDQYILGADLTAGPVTINSLMVEEGYTLGIGTAATNTYLQFDFGTETNRIATLAGTGETYLDLDNSLRILVLRAGSTASEGKQMLHLIGATNPLLDIQCRAGEKVGLAANAGETATFTTINVYSGDVFIGVGVTCTTLNVYGGRVENWAAIGTINQYGGSIEAHGAHATAVTVEGGFFYERATGTTTDVFVTKSGVIDASKDSQARTYTNTTLTDGGTLLDPNETITLTNGIDLSHSSLGTTTINLGEHFTIKKEAI